jgi:c-di-GMP-binding flagellar brake protein YcgR
MLASAVTFWRWLTGQPVSLDAKDAPAESGEANDERRVWLRYAADLNTRCAEVGDDGETGIAATIRDISRGGLKVIASRRFEPGTVLSVELPSVSGESALAVLMCVVRAQPHGDTEWAMGCRFSGELSDEQLQAFGAARTRPTPPDARGWSRFPCEAKAIYQRVGERDTAPRSAHVLNISAAGMALVTDEEIAIGELLSTELHHATGKTIVTILACVVHVQQTEEGRVLGCNFIRELNDADLKALV